MSTIHRCGTAVSVSVVATVLMFALFTPIAVQAEDQVVAEEQVLAAEEQIPVLAPAVPSWSESSGYASVERTRATASALLSGELISGQEQAAALAAADAMSWDEVSGYGSVEASRAVPDEIDTP